MIAGLTFSVSQDGLNCGYVVAPTSPSFTASGGANTINVTATAGCPWTAASSAPFITINAGASGTGNGTVNYSVARNVSPDQRTATLTVAGQIITVTQAPAALLGNIATRLRVEAGDNALIGGFIITGSQPKRVLLRAIGPSLPVAGALADPQLQIFNSRAKRLASTTTGATRATARKSATARSHQATISNPRSCAVSTRAPTRRWCADRATRPASVWWKRTISARERMRSWPISPPADRSRRAIT